MAGRVKKRDHEKLTDANIKKVIELLEATPPISKKDACEILNISYNTTRLTKIIEEWKSDREYREKRKAEKRGKPASKDEIALMVESYLEGDAISEIAKRVYRSPGFVKATIERIGVPVRPSGEDKKGIEFLPEACVAEEFKPGEIAWSAAYHAPCEVRELLPEKYTAMYAGPCYRVWINEKSQDTDTRFGAVSGGFNAYAPAYDLGKLEHLKEYGVKIENL